MGGGSSTGSLPNDSCHRDQRAQSKSLATIELGKYLYASDEELDVGDEFGGDANGGDPNDGDPNDGDDAVFWNSLNDMTKNNFHQQQQWSRTTAAPVLRGPASASSDQINNNNSSSTSSAATATNNSTVSQILMGTNPDYR